jgi:hypothetical protein
MVTKYDVKDKILVNHFNSISNFEATNCYSCEHFTYQEDCNGEIAITHCAHGKNLDKLEGNTKVISCPFVETI